jgi:adenylate kinase family enzyme
MKRIWISGTSGSGKTTLSNILGTILKIPVYHRDQISYGPNWELISEKDQINKIKAFTSNDRWIFDGCRFTSSKIDGRLDNCDTLIHLETNKFVCIFRGIKRYIQYKNKPRKDLPENCKEEYSFDLIKYVLLEYPGKSNYRKDFFSEAVKMGKKVFVLKNKTEINDFVNSTKYNCKSGVAVAGNVIYNSQLGSPYPGASQKE